MIPLGAFELQSRLGQGGMGEVWRGVHRGQHVPVAIKLLTNALARKAAFRAAFRNEVRAVAGLDHPHIVLVFDYGTVDARTQEASGGVLRAGTPWLAMELAEEGSLDDPRHIRSWPRLRGVLLSLLDALAHAHARGVVHRDIKPGNVLLAAGHTLKLTDFGLAHAMDREESDFVAGTPSYMAPEQFEGRWRDYGPWTDLYAVGCLVHALCGGEPPYGILHDWHAGHAAHVSTPVPDLASRFRVPEGLSAWAARLLAKDPSDRFRRAADAAWALLELPELVEAGPIRGGGAADEATLIGEATVPLAFTVPVAPPSTPSLEPTRALSPAPPTRPGAAVVEQAAALTGLEPPSRALTRAPPTRATREPSRVGGDGAAVLPPVDAHHPDVPPLPRTWKRPEPPARSPRLLGAGLGLFGLRTVPLVGRRGERDRLWAALQAVHRTHEPHAVVLQGPLGCGKTRLARWLVERAHEVGGAQVLQGAGGEGGGVAGMLARHLRCVGLDRQEIRGRVSAWLRAAGEHDPGVWDEVTDILQGAPASALRTPGDRPRALALLLRRLCRERPLVLWIDEAHEDPEALELLRLVLDAELADLPVLLLVSAPDDVRQAVRGRLQALRHHPRGQGLDLGPLAETHRAELVRQLLGLEGPLAVEVERRTGGNPRFAVELVGDWVQRGLLEPGRRGFRLKDGAVPDVPDDLRTVWSERLDRVLEGRSAAEAIALELAAIVGHDVDWGTWTAVCEVAGVPCSGELVEALLIRRLARCALDGPEAGWSFEHALLREILEDRARAAGRLAGHHRACAEVLHGCEDRGVPERLGQHLIGAGEPLLAIDPLLIAIDERLAAGELSRANVLLAERQQAMEQGGLTPDDMRHAEGWVRWGRLAEALGRHGDADAWAGRAVGEARDHRWGRVLVDGLILRGRLARRRGDAAEAWRLLDEAEGFAQRDPTGWRLGLARLELGRLHLDRGATDKAAEVLRLARGDLEAAQDHGAVADVFIALSRAAVLGARLGAATVLLDWARGRHAWLGCRIGVARCQVHTARVSRLRGSLDAAAEAIHEAIDDLRSLGSAEVLDAELELGWLALARGDLDLARARADHAVRTWAVHGLEPATARGHALLLGVAAATGDTRAVDRHLDRVRRLLTTTGLVDVDVESSLRAVGTALDEAGESQRAQDARALAATQHEVLARGRERAKVG